MSEANAETVKTKAEISYSNGAGGFEPSKKGNTLTGHYPGESINFGGFDVPYNGFTAGAKVFTKSADGVELGTNYHGTDSEGFETPHVVKVNTLDDAPNGGKEGYKPFINNNDWGDIDDKVGIIEKYRVGVNARDPNDEGTWNADNEIYMYFLRDLPPGEDVMAYFGNFAPQDAGPLSEIMVSYHPLNDFDLDGVSGTIGDLEVLAENWLETINYEDYDPTTDFYKKLCDIEGINNITQEVIEGNGRIDYEDFERFAQVWKGAE